MKIDFIIISGILVILSFLPFIILPFLIGKDRNKLKTRFKEEASGLGLNISYELVWNTNRAGIDILKKHFLFIQNIESNFIIQHFNFERVHQVKMLVENKEVLQKEKRIDILSKVTLEFYESNPEEIKTVILFDNDKNYIQDFEIKNAKILVNEIQKYLTAYGKLGRTA